MKQNQVSDKLITWEQTVDIHKPFWDVVRSDAVNYYDIRNSVIEGMLSGSAVDYDYAETGVTQYELQIR